jgi:hypothetical protein
MPAHDRLELPARNPRFASQRPPSLRLAMAAAFAGAAMAQSAVPTDAALVAALEEGVWCASNDDGRSCWAYEEFKPGNVITTCGQTPGARQPFTASARYEVKGRALCYEVTERNEHFWLLRGSRFCTEILEMTPDYQRYRDVQTGEESVLYRLPKSARRCSDSDT